MSKLLEQSLLNIDIPKHYRDYPSMKTMLQQVNKQLPINIDELDNFQKRLFHECDRIHLIRLKNDGKLLNATIPILGRFNSEFDFYSKPPLLLDEYYSKYKDVLSKWIMYQLNFRKEDGGVDTDTPEYQIIIEKLLSIKNDRNDLRKRKKKYLVNLFKCIDDYDQIIKLLVENKFIAINDDNTLNWIKQKENGLEHLTTICVLGAKLNRESHFNKTTQTEIAESLTNTIVDFDISKQFYGKILKEIEKDTEKIQDYYTLFYFI